MRLISNGYAHEYATNNKQCGVATAKRVYKEAGVGALLGMVSAVILMAFITPIVSISESETDPPDPGTLFMAATTIMALAAFGSARGARIQRKPKKKDLAWRARLFVPISILCLITIQAWFMQLLATSKNIHGTWMAGYSPVEWWIFATATCLIMVSFFVTLGNSYSADEMTPGGPDMPP